jgi:hypothetical protein
MRIRERMDAVLVKLDEHISGHPSGDAYPERLDVIIDPIQRLHRMAKSEVDLMKRGAFWKLRYKPARQQYPERK